MNTSIFKPRYGGALRPGMAMVMAPDAAAAQAVEEPPAAAGRLRFADLNEHLHCSVIGTCLTDAELRKIVRPYTEVAGATELQIHHEAVRLARTDAQAARALHKALDRRYEPVVRRFQQVRDAAGLEALWTDCLRRGEVAGAYWAVLTHRHTTAALRQQVFGEVHMLSHLMGASTRVDIRQRVVLEAENAELRQQQAQLQERYQRLVDLHERAEQEHQQRQALLLVAQERLAAALTGTASGHETTPDLQAGQVARATALRERAEVQAQGAVAQSQQLQELVEQLQRDLAAQGSELHAAEAQLRGWLDADETQAAPSLGALAGRRLLYVGGRPSSSVAIRALVERAGGDIRRHDGGLEDRKGQLAALIAWADTVVFPVDCVDHDSALNLKRQCSRLGIPFVALRTASVASFVAALADTPAVAEPQPQHRFCLRHG